MWNSRLLVICCGREREEESGGGEYPAGREQRREQRPFTLTHTHTHTYTLACKHTRTVLDAHMQAVDVLPQERERERNREREKREGERHSDRGDQTEVRENPERSVLVCVVQPESLRVLDSGVYFGGADLRVCSPKKKKKGFTMTERIWEI